MRRRSWWMVWLCAGWLLGTAQAAAQIVVFESNAGDAGESVVETLRIQLSGTRTSLVLRPMPQAQADLEATRLVREGSAELVVWVGSPARGEYALHYVGWRGANVTHATTRLTAERGPSLERTMALKVREVLDEFVRFVPADGGDAAQAPPVPEPEPQRSPPTSRGGERHAAEPRLLGELSAGAASGAGSASAQLQLGGAAGLGIEALRGRAELWLGAHWASAQSAAIPAGRVEATEWMPKLELRAGWPRGRIRWGAYARFALRVVSASGTTAEGERGARTRAVPVLAFGPDAGWALAPHIAIRGALGVELAPAAQRFAVAEETALDLGRTRVLLELSVGFSSR